ncbi:Ig-like domain-containing protein [Algoriphagus sp. D3-2-R+10]|uniref:Ig-like domain-containing protein n=1 Tax=Algoriphagus aurantiacus TaxID=3103948 RepID=UPI002B36B592|nr:Ig-like domain-containing protein [Algoriphagus sp. D3-2-R+10]MEB2774213.1 Ig-like domain-containing protein [Algoriphagus sp. D3-2-R+10]
MKFTIFQIRLCGIHSLIFFSALCIFSCSNKTEEDISIVWDNERAIGLKIPLSSNHYKISEIEVRLVQDGNRVPILGEFKEEENLAVFLPLIPFTRGQRYEVFGAERKLGDVLIPDLNAKEANLSLVEIYPTKDTVPENLLKLFLKFSKPMREGESLSYLTLIKGTSDTLSGVFLDLQPELWNEDQTLLTVWLDPGRIKRDLIPNLEMGAPLTNSEKYKLIVSSEWKGLNGGILDQTYTKDFFVTVRDSISPDPSDWILDIPIPGSKSALHINFNQSLDYSLLGDVFKIKYLESEKISGIWQIGIEEKSIAFTPTNEWQKGNYTLEIESRLEDLAGNNLSRLFETDLENPVTSKIESRLHQIIFEIK